MNRSQSRGNARNRKGSAVQVKCFLHTGYIAGKKSERGEICETMQVIYYAGDLSHDLHVTRLMK